MFASVHAALSFYRKLLPDQLFFHLGPVLPASSARPNFIPHFCPEQGPHLVRDQKDAIQ